MVSPATSLQLVRTLTEMYSAAERRTLELVAKYVARGLDSPDYLQRRLAEIHALQVELRQVVAGLNAHGPQEVAKAVLEAHRLGQADAVRELTRAGISETLSSLQTRASIDAITALATKTADKLATTHLRILRVGEDAYRSIVGQVAGEAMTGVYTRRTAAQAVLDRFANAGITGFIDEAGRNWNLASYAEMAMRTVTGQSCVQGAIDGYQANGRDLVIVSEVPEDCPMCAEWDGQVLSISGDDAEHASVQEATDAGLFHPGCRHNLGLYVEGLTNPSTYVQDEQGYEDSQQQRYLERGVRQWKCREAVAIDDLAAARARAKVREWQGKLREHVSRTGSRRLYYREQIGKAI